MADIRRRKFAYSEEREKKCGGYNLFKETVTKKIHKLKEEEKFISDEEYVLRLEDITSTVFDYIVEGKWVSAITLKSLHISTIKCRYGCEYAILYDNAVIAFDMLVAVFCYRIDTLLYLYDTLTKRYSDTCALKTIVALYFHEMSKNTKNSNAGKGFKSLTEESSRKLSYYNTMDEEEYFPDGFDDSKSLTQITGYRVYNRGKR